MYRSGIGVTQIMKQLNAAGRNVTREFVRYWIKKYELGKFDLGMVTQTVSGKGKIMHRDIDVINHVMQTNPNVSARDIHTVLKSDGATFSL